MAWRPPDLTPAPSQHQDPVQTEPSQPARDTHSQAAFVAAGPCCPLDGSTVRSWDWTVLCIDEWQTETMGGAWAGVGPGEEQCCDKDGGGASIAEIQACASECLRVHSSVVRC